MPDLWVECAPLPEPGIRPGPEPVRIGWDQSEGTRVQVIDRWHGDGSIDFRVRASDGATYIVRRDERSGGWRLLFFRRAGS